MVNLSDHPARQSNTQDMRPCIGSGRDGGDADNRDGDHTG
jgi:hypothetical protein